MSADEQTILVVSYADLKACCERSFIELMERSSVELYNAGLPPSFVSLFSSLAYRNARAKPNYWRESSTFKKKHIIFPTRPRSWQNPRRPNDRDIKISIILYSQSLRHREPNAKALPCSLFYALDNP
jgi:hypothetical protein